jgi:hypothetical protein
MEQEVTAITLPHAASIRQAPKFQRGWVLLQIEVNSLQPRCRGRPRHLGPEDHDYITFQLEHSHNIPLKSITVTYFSYLFFKPTPYLQQFEGTETFLHFEDTKSPSTNYQ